MSKKTGKPKGRPSKFKNIEDRMEDVKKLLLHGFTDKELADFFNVSESTLNLYKLQHPEFSESIKRAKLEADLNVERSLYERACGYSHPDVDIKQYEGQIIITNIVKYYPPDTGAAFIWLKNRQGWKDKQEIIEKSEITVIRDDIK